MAARRCTLCGISYPDEYKFYKCPFHAETTAFINNDGPDEDWDVRLNFLVRQRERDERDSELIPEIDGPVELYAGQLWIHSWDVIDSGIRYRLKDGDLVKVGRVFEVIGYVDARRSYIVRAFDTEVMDEAITELLRG